MRGVPIVVEIKTNEQTQIGAGQFVTTTTTGMHVRCSRRRGSSNINKGGADKNICELLHAIRDLVHQNTRIVAVAGYLRNASI